MSLASAPPKRPKLVLHFDVNETILIGDPAGGDSFEDCLNKIIAKSAFVRSTDASSPLLATSLSQLAWRDGSPLGGGSSDVSRAHVGGSSDGAHPPPPTNPPHPPPLLTDWHWPDGCAPFYKCAKRCGYDARRFTEPGEPGRGYRGVYEQMERALRLPTDGEHADGERHPSPSGDGVHHLLIPAFFEALDSLLECGREFTLVVRTFGSDGPRVADAISRWAALPSACAASRHSLRRVAHASLTRKSHTQVSHASLTRKSHMQVSRPEFFARVSYPR